MAIDYELSSAEISEADILSRDSDPAETPLPVDPDVSDSAVDTLDPAVDTLDPAMDTRDPTVDTLDPAIDTLDPAIDTLDPAVETLDPAVDTLDPAVDTLDPAFDTIDSVEFDLDPDDSALDILDPMESHMQRLLAIKEEYHQKAHNNIRNAQQRQKLYYDARHDSHHVSLLIFMV